MILTKRSILKVIEEYQMRKVGCRTKMKIVWREIQILQDYFITKRLYTEIRFSWELILEWMSFIKIFAWKDQSRSILPSSILESYWSLLELHYCVNFGYPNTLHINILFKTTPLKHGFFSTVIKVTGSWLLLTVIVWSPCIYLNVTGTYCT